MMLTCLAVIPIFTAVIFDRYLSSTFGNILALLLALIIINNGLLANISYFYMVKCYEKGDTIFSAKYSELNFRLLQKTDVPSLNAIPRSAGWAFGLRAMQRSCETVF